MAPLSITDTFLAAAGDTGFKVIAQLDSIAGVSATPETEMSIQGHADASFPPPPPLTGRPFGLEAPGEFPVWLVTRGVGGQPGDDLSHSPSLSYDGSKVAFASVASDLTGQDMPPCGFEDTIPSTCLQVYLADLRTGMVALASSDPAGTPGNGASSRPQISGDGEHVAFATAAENLGAGPAPTVLLKHFATGAVDRIDVNTQGEGANVESDPNDPNYGSACAVFCGPPSLAWAGSTVAFTSWSSNLAGNDTNRRPDVFLRDWANANTVLVSDNASGGIGDDASYALSGGRFVSSSGGRVAFTSSATNLVADAPPDCPSASPVPAPYRGKSCLEVYVKDLASGATVMASRSEQGQPGTAMSQAAVLSGNGRQVAFITTAPELVGTATNHQQAVVKDLETGRLQVISRRAGQLWPEDVLWVAIDEAGRRVAFSSGASMRSGDSSGETPSAGGIYVWQEGLAEPVLASVHRDGSPSQASANTIAISGDGRWLAFDSGDALVPGSRGHQVYVVDVDLVLEGEPRSASAPAAWLPVLVLAGIACLLKASVSLRQERTGRQRR